MSDIKNDALDMRDLLQEVVSPLLDAVEEQQARLLVVYMKLSSAVEVILETVTNGMSTEELKVFDGLLAASEKQALQMLREATDADE